MNHIYRSLWNQKAGTFVAVSENTKSGGQQASSASNATVGPGVGLALKTLAVALLMAFGSNVYALPMDGVVTAGTAVITSVPGSMTVNQNSQNVALNWQSFNIGQGETVRFVQPNSSAVALNRVLGADPSSILGNLSANGKVFLVNPNGILFGQGASVNVGGLVASTLNISDSDFMAGNYKFAGAGKGSILNQGTIHVDGGYVALLGANVSNQGVIAARLGTVALAAGNAITLDVAGDGLLNVSVDQGAVNALVSNGGLLQADGGQVLLSAQAAGNLLHTAVNNTGVIQAHTIENRNGTIKLLGDMQSGTVHVAGKLDASAPTGGDGGFVETSAVHVQVADEARVTTAAAQGKTGNWLIDPSDYTIAASGGDITGATLSSNLGSTAVTILSSAGTQGGINGDVNVNDTVSWSANKLTLNAYNNININTAMHASGTASLALEYGQGAVAAGNTSMVNVRAPINLPSGNNFSTKLGSNGSTVNYTVINSLGAAGSSTGTDLQGMIGNLSGNYVLGSNIDASATAGWNAGKGFTPITSYQTIPDPDPFCEPFCMPINQTLPFTGTFDGLGHTISNLTINRPTESNIGLFGSIQLGAAVRNLGLIGGSISGAFRVGGLAGENKGTISNSYATANLSGSSSLGGLVGRNGGAISSSYATGNVIGKTSAIGGLVGFNNAAIDNSYSTGNVSGTNYMGGLVGSNEPGGMVRNSYATGNVAGGYFNGGLVGFNTAQINTSYASGSVSGNSDNGGLVGYSAGGGTITNSYWNSAANAKGIGVNNNSATTTGLNASEMQTASNFAGFNFTTTPGAAGNNWVMVNGNGSLNNAGGAVGATRPMLASEYSTTINNAHQLQLMAMNLGASYSLGQNINATATGTANDVWISGTFIPVGNVGKQFTGTFGGLNHTIDGLTINQPSTSYTGLFGATAAGASISNVGLIGGSVTATGASYVGGLVGRNSGTVSNSFATISVKGDSYVGGLVGYMPAGGTINNSYTGGTVTGTTRAAGLVGRNEGTISNSYAMGAVTGGNNFGLTSLNNGVVSNSFWNTETTGTSQSFGGTGLTTAQMMQLASFSSWNDAAPNTIANTGGSGAVWRIYEGHTAPLLTSFMTGLTLSGAPDMAVSYNGNAQSGASITAPAGVFGAAASGTNAGFYNGYYSNQLGYDITGGNLTINAAVLSAISLNGTRAYDGTTDVAASIFTLSGLVAGQDLILTGMGTIGSKNVGIYSVNLGSLTLGDGANGLASNYTFTGGTQTATITKANLTLSSSDVSKTYDGGLTAAGSATVTGGTLFAGDTIGGGAFAFADKNAGSNKTVTVAGVTVSDGNGGGNYNVSYASNTTSTIAQKALTIGGITASDKTYDGTTAATVNTASTSYTGLVNGDVVTVSASGTFGDRNAGAGKTVNLNSSYGGADVGNYSITGQAATTASIGQASLTLSSSDVSKTYDGGLTAAGSATVTGGTLFAGDALAGGSFAFTDKNAGSNKTVTVAGVTVSDGNGGGNYNLSYADNNTSTIIPYTVSLSGQRIYDGSTTAASDLFSLGSLVGSETLTLSGSGTVADKNVGRDKSVSLGTLALGDGSGLASNYTLGGSAPTASITPATLMVSAADTVQVFGNAEPRLDFIATGLALGDSLATAVGGSLARDPGQDVGLYGIHQGSLASVDGNYQLLFTPGSFRIVPRVQAVVPDAPEDRPGASMATALPLPTLQQLSQRRDVEDILRPDLALMIVDGGMRMPVGWQEP